MKFALFLGCKIPYFLKSYETATRKVLNTFGVGLMDLDFNCCGYPTRDFDSFSYVLSSARNFALAEREGVPIVTPCKCCFGSLKKASHLLEADNALRGEVDKKLAEEGLKYRGRYGVKHLLSVLYHDVGVEAIKKQASAPLKGLKVAPHYGCHALRPGKVLQFDDPVAPVIFDRLVEATGARSVSWPLRLQCCGNPLWDKNKELSRELTRKKFADAKEAGADYLCSACTYCQMQFERVRDQSDWSSPALPSILYPQLLGLAMELEPEALGLNREEADIVKRKSLKAQEAEEEKEKAKAAKKQASAS